MVQNMVMDSMDMHPPSDRRHVEIQVHTHKGEQTDAECITKDGQTHVKKCSIDVVEVGYHYDKYNVVLIDRCEPLYFIARSR
jgi:hypothetical protein